MPYFENQYAKQLNKLLGKVGIPEKTSVVNSPYQNTARKILDFLGVGDAQGDIMNAVNPAAGMAASSRGARALKILDDYYTKHPRGMQDMSRSARHDDQGDFTKFIFDDSQGRMDQALSRFPEKPSLYYTGASINYEIPENVLAAQTHLSRAYRDYNLTPEQKKDLEEWLERLLGGE